MCPRVCSVSAAIFLALLWTAAADEPNDKARKYYEALLNARRLVSLANDPPALETALSLALRMTERAKQSDGRSEWH